MDEKQYITYVILCCTLLLGLLNEGCNSNLKLSSYLQQAIPDEVDERNMTDLTQELKVRGGHDQPIVFLTSAAGARKSTALKGALRFCFKFCLVMGMPWSNYTFFHGINRIYSNGHRCVYNIQVCILMHKNSTD